MFSKFKASRKQAAPGQEAPTTAYQHAPGLESATPTLLEAPSTAPTAQEKATDQQSFHSAASTNNHDPAKYLASPESDLKKLPSGTDPVLADLEADGDGKQEGQTAGGEAEEDDEGYLSGFPLWMAYLSMLLSIFLVSLDFTIM